MMLSEAMLLDKSRCVYQCVINRCQVDVGGGKELLKKPCNGREGIKGYPRVRRKRHPCVEKRSCISQTFSSSQDHFDRVRSR